MDTNWTPIHRGGELGAMNLERLVLATFAEASGVLFSKGDFFGGQIVEEI